MLDKQMEMMKFSQAIPAVRLNLFLWVGAIFDFTDSPVLHVVYQMLFEHEAPCFDGVNETLLEWFGVDEKPAVD